MLIRGVVAQTRVDVPGRPCVELVYVKRPDQCELMLVNEPAVEWTPDRAEALVLDWDAAQGLAQRIGWPAHAITATTTGSRCVKTEHPTAHRHIDPPDVFESLERRGLA